MPAVIAAVAVIALTVTVAGPVLIAAANGDTVVNMLDCIKKLIQQIRERAPGMPKPPPGRSKKDMEKAAQELGLKYKYYNFGFCGPQGAGKSSLINSLRDLPNVEKTQDWNHDIFNAAPTGETETTTRLNQYG
ncbi:unnamed protein product [Rotaria socialis]|uniref:Uncharacterized protein n=1 Tax=Rotaria socialis TaxID=392032 RepID=A0A818NCK2_9BILA|nr:unnamed protein product [Rotaria socialis]CAF3601897.1 unnamed protein product [Rotaria socialis]